MINTFNLYKESPSLLLYQNEVVSNENANNEFYNSEQNKNSNNDLNILNSNNNISNALNASNNNKNLPPIEVNLSDKEILNSMFLPREWEEQGKKYIQYVSPDKASREQARDLYKALDEKIKQRQAREKGICPVREELYAQCFDEIIRQVTIECPERGLLLLRVRDEIRMTIASYQTLYESAILFGIRKQLQAESGKEECKAKLEELEKNKIKLTNEKLRLENHLKAINKRFEERNQIEKKRREDDIEFLNNQTKNLEILIVRRPNMNN